MNCGCNDEIPIVSYPDDASGSVEVRGIGDIKVTPSDELGKKIYTVELSPFTPPVINATANPLREVGATFDFDWIVSITPGRENIASREIIPEPIPVPDLLLPFTVSKTNLKVTSRQSVDYHTINVRDVINTLVSRKLSISYVNKVYVGFSSKDGLSAGQALTEADILAFTGTLADSIKSTYSGAKDYVIPMSGVLKYIYWVYEVGTIPINYMTLSGLPFPIIFVPGSTPVTNPNDALISTNYVIVRSANKFGNGTLSITML